MTSARPPEMHVLKCKTSTILDHGGVVNHENIRIFAILRLKGSIWRQSLLTTRVSIELCCCHDVDYVDNVSHLTTWLWWPVTIITLIPNKTRETVEPSIGLLLSPHHVNNRPHLKSLLSKLQNIDSSRQQDSGGCNSLLSPDHVNNHPRGRQDNKTGDLQR